MLYYSVHARNRMKERHISQNEVEECINHPDIRYPSKDNVDCINCVKYMSNSKRIRVVVNVKKPSQMVVISVMV